MNGNTLQMTGYKTVNILDRADAIDKAGSSGVIKVNEVREVLIYHQQKMVTVYYDKKL
ncbi:hypothetical protein GCM10017706_31720 [Lactococcus lactis subsp. hordniae]